MRVLEVGRKEKDVGTDLAKGLMNVGVKGGNWGFVWGGVGL
jgi:hypothetical protein